MKHIPLALTTLIVALLLAACAPQTAELEPATVRLRLKWLHQTQFAGVYAAEKEGYYAAENLTVQIEPVDMERQVTYELLLTGEADIAIGAAEEVMIARREGKPVRAVAVIFRLNPLIYMAPADKGINKPQDLIGRSIMLSPGQGTYLYEAMMGRLGIDRATIKELPMTTYDLYECWQFADVCAHYATNGLARAQYDGVPATAIWPVDYGVPFYADVLITTDAFIQEHPDVVERFVRATLKGWQRAIENPEQATQYTLDFDPDLDAAFQLAAMNASIPLIDTGEAQLGYMQPEVWQQMHDIMLEQGLISAPVNLSQVYTNEFVEQVYAQK